MKTKLTHRIFLAALAVTLLCGTALAAGAIKTQMIEANYMGIKLVVNGIEITPKDATGREVEPFASNGTTYLPVRAVAAALGQDVEWDGETRTVYIGEIPGKATNWMTKLPPYQLGHAATFDGSNHKEYFTVAGKDQPLGVVMETSADYWDPRIGGPYKKSADKYHGSAVWNTDCKYKTMNFTIGHMGNQQVDCELEIYLDGVYSQTIDLPWSSTPQKLSIPLNYAPNVRLELLSCDEAPVSTVVTSQYGLYDISFE